MKTKYTPGPWRIGRHLGSPSGVRLIHKDVGDKGQGVPIIEGVVSIEDARLIAAAPEQNAELVKVLRFLADLNGCEWIKGDDAGSVDMRQRAKALQSSVCAVIAKAEGR